MQGRMRGNLPASNRLLVALPGNARLWKTTGPGVPGPYRASVNRLCVGRGDPTPPMFAAVCCFRFICRGRRPRRPASDPQMPFATKQRRGQDPSLPACRKSCGRGRALLHQKHFPSPPSCTKIIGPMPSIDPIVASIFTCETVR